ncbi:MAG: heme-binding protein, partial [Parvularcula sp.]
GGGGTGNAPAPTNAGGSAPQATRLYADPAAVNLSVSDVETILAQAIAEAKARNTPATIAIVDRVGNVLAVYRMVGAPIKAEVTPAPNGNDLGLQGQDVPDTLAAISKAVTGAYLSSAGNAFTSRTASMIVQQHFPPAPNLTPGLESGPLFGVQFSQLPCSDLNTRYAVGQGPFIGPARAPLGLSADPGGMPLYIGGTLVGGIGVSADDTYTFDPDVQDVDVSDEEAIAIAGFQGFAAPDGIRANRILVDGTALRFSDMTVADLVSSPGTAPAFSSLTAGDGALVPVRGYFGEDTPAILAGTAYGSEQSGIRPSSAFNTPDAYVLSDGFGTNRYTPRAGTEGTADSLTAAEVTALLEEAFGILSKARAQIRQPENSRAQVSVSVVDTNGAILGVIRSPDAPIFGIDVSLQKARTATFFSGSVAATELLAAGRSPLVMMGGAGLPQPDVGSYVGRVRQLLDDPNALTGTHAFADRSGGNLSRPYFPDGEVGNGPGPLSVPIENFNPFANGLQIDLVSDNILEHVTYVLGGVPQDTRRGCTFLPPRAATGTARLANGMQIFPGSVPIYRGDTLIGGIGVSGDGIDQDDMISFLGLYNAGLRTGTINHARPEIRADRIVINLNGGRQVRLRYVNCPFSPFINSAEQNVCQGK